MSSDLSALLRRVEEMEHKVWGSSGTNVVSRGQEEICKNIAEYSSDLGNNLAGQDRINPLIKKIDELESFLDPSFGDSLAQTDMMLQNIVLAQQDTIERKADQVDEVKALQVHLDGGNVTQAPEVSSKLATLSRIQVEGGEKADILSAQTMLLVEKYNAIISALTDSFIQADAQITEAEQKAANKKVAG